MNNKIHNIKWFDAKVLIASLGFLFTLWLWNTLSQDLVVPTTGTNLQTNTLNPVLATASPAYTNVQPTPFTRILMGGAAPQLSQSGSSAPQPITQTSSSK